MKRKAALRVGLVLVAIALASCARETGSGQTAPAHGNSTEAIVENRAVAQGVIIGEVYFNDIPISRFFKEPFIDILGEPLSVRGPHFDFGDDLGILGRFNHDLWAVDIIEAMFIDAPHLVRANDIPLNSNREELIALLGNPIEYYEYPTGWIFHQSHDERNIRYHIFSPAIVYALEIWFEPDDTVNLVVIRTYGT